MIVLGRIATTTALALGLLTQGAFAYWSGAGEGSASMSMATLSAPAITAATPGAETVELTWSAVAPPSSGTVAYYVTRDGGAPGAGCPSSTSPATATSCIDTGASIGAHEYTVTAVWRTWTAQSAVRSASVAFRRATHFQVQAASATPTAGEADDLTITAKDAANNTVVTYSGSHSVIFEGPVEAPNATKPVVTDKAGVERKLAEPTEINFSEGKATASGADNGVLRLYDAQTTTLTVKEGTLEGTSGSLTVKAGQAKKLSVPTPSEHEAGVAFNVTLTAADEWGNLTKAYTGTKTLAWSGPASSPSGQAPEYPSSATAVTFAEGVGTAAAIKLYDAQSTTLKAKEGSIEGVSGSFTVKAAATTRFAVPTPGEQQAGAAFNVTLTATDEWGNLAKTYTGSKKLTFGEPADSPSGQAPSYPASVTFSEGVGTASAIKLYDAQSTPLKVKLSSAEGASGSFTVKAAGAEHLAWSQPEVTSGGFKAGSTPFACITTSIGHSAVFKARASVTDGYGNIVSNLGASDTAKVEKTSGAGMLANASGLTIPASGPAESSTTFEYTSPTSGTSEAVMTLKVESGTSYSEAEAHVKY
jgi:trimeric autotransporter adhesin